MTPTDAPSPPTAADRTAIAAHSTAAGDLLTRARAEIDAAADAVAGADALGLYASARDLGDTAARLEAHALGMRP